MLWDGEDVAALAPLAESRQAATRRKVTVRIYTHRVDSRQQHSYIMGSETGGLGARLSETVEFTAETTTLEELRVNLEVFMDRGMVRRSGIFQEYMQVGFGSRRRRALMSLSPSTPSRVAR